MRGLGSYAPFAVATAALMVAAQACAQNGPSRAAARPKPDSLIFAGLPSMAEYRSGLWSALRGEDDHDVCLDFTVHALERPVAGVKLTTSGLGDARLGLLTGTPTTLCDGVNARLLTLGEVATQGTRVRVRLPGASFVHAGSMDGRLIAMAPGRDPIEAKLQLQRAGWGPFWNGVFWFLGVFVPATVTAVIGLGVFQLQKRIELRSAERMGLAQFRKDSGSELRKFFAPTGLFASIVTDASGETYSNKMAEELGKRGVITALTIRSRERLISAMRKADKKKVAGILAEAFPDYRNEIEASTP
jgi:hypothetical protein